MDQFFQGRPFALSPLPSAQLFAAAGFAGIRLLGFTLAFFAGRLVSYSIYAYSAKGIRETSMNDLFTSMFSSPMGIALQVAMIGFVVLLVRIDWSKLLNKVGVKDASEKSANGSSKP